VLSVTPLPRQVNKYGPVTKNFKIQKRVNVSLCQNWRLKQLLELESKAFRSNYITSLRKFSYMQLRIVTLFTTSANFCKELKLKQIFFIVPVVMDDQKKQKIGIYNRFVKRRWQPLSMILIQFSICFKLLEILTGFSPNKKHAFRYSSRFTSSKSVRVCGTQGRSRDGGVGGRQASLSKCCLALLRTNNE